MSFFFHAAWMPKIRRRACTIIATSVAMFAADRK
jgi:hypothetical protein